MTIRATKLTGTATRCRAKFSSAQRRAVVRADAADRLLDQFSDPNGDLARDWDHDHDQHFVEKLRAGPHGAGKTTFFRAHFASAGLRFVDADVLAAELAVGPYEAAHLADALRKALISRGESFVFETVFFDPVGDKVAFLEDAAGRGYVAVLCYIGLSGPDQSGQRVAMRVSQGGHDVPDDKLRARFSRSVANLRAASARIPHVLIYDNGDLNVPYRLVAVFERGQWRHHHEPIPEWLRPVLP